MRGGPPSTSASRRRGTFAKIELSRHSPRSARCRPRGGRFRSVRMIRAPVFVRGKAGFAALAEGLRDFAHKERSATSRGSTAPSWASGRGTTGRRSVTNTTQLKVMGRLPDPPRRCGGGRTFRVLQREPLAQQHVQPFHGPHAVPPRPHPYLHTTLEPLAELGRFLSDKRRGTRHSRAPRQKGRAAPREVVAPVQARHS